VQEEPRLGGAACLGVLRGAGGANGAERDVRHPEPGGPGGRGGGDAARLAAHRDDGLHPRAAVGVERREERAEGCAARGGVRDPRAVEAEGDAPGLARLETLADDLAEGVSDRGPRGVGEGHGLVAPVQERRREGDAIVELGDGGVEP